MSGGSMEYLYGRVQDASFRENTPLRRAFREHLNLVAKALRAIEWNDSGDGDDTEEDAIRACIGQQGELSQLIEDAIGSSANLESWLRNALRARSVSE